MRSSRISSRPRDAEIYQAGCSTSFLRREKSLMNEIGERPGVGHVRFPVESYHRRVHFRPRFESARRHSKAVRHGCVVLDENGKRPVFAGSRFCRKPFRNFLLNHHRDIQDAVAIFDESFEQRCRDVVGQIADKMKRFGGELNSSASPSTMSTFAGMLAKRKATRSRSISMAMTCDGTARRVHE